MSHATEAGEHRAGGQPFQVEELEQFGREPVGQREHPQERPLAVGVVLGGVAQLNIDMIGRNRDDQASEANTVYLVGSDRISSELHALNRTANASLAKPLTLDYEFNDPTDLEQLYYRSDHYSYAAKGIPMTGPRFI